MRYSRREGPQHPPSENAQPKANDESDREAPEPPQL